MGNNPFLMRPLVTDGLDNFALTSNRIGLDVIRRIFERALPNNSPDVRKYDQKVRQPVSETLTKEYLTITLGAPAFRESYHYLAPKAGQAVDSLARDSETIRQSSDDVEGDALYLIDDVAIIVEVKGKSIADQARRGDIRRLKNDLKATIGHGAHQATRLRELIEANGGIWEDRTTWLDLSHVREVRMVVVVLDDIGPLGTKLSDLQDGGLLSEDRPPLILSLHDLAVISEICERPSEFLLYLRRRTDSPVTKYFRAVDELDLYMLLLAGDLYVDDDPDEVRIAHPTASPPTKSERRRHQESAVGTMVSDNCLELNIWMNRDNIHPDGVVAKPSFNAPTATLGLLDSLRRGMEPGWFRFGADLLALAGDAQSQLLSTIKLCSQTTRRDGSYHEAMTACAGLWGFATFFVATHPSGIDEQKALERLRLYAKAKQYQLQADRAYGLVFDQNGNFESSFYLSSVSKHDLNLDRLVAEMKLKPVGQRVPPIPPSARRAKKRLR